MIEAVVALGLALLAFFIGYGSLRQQVKNNRQVSDERYNFVVKEIDALKENHEVLQQVLISLAELKKGITFIREMMKPTEK